MSVITNKAIFSDGWYLEGKTAWFISPEDSSLYEMNIDSWKCRRLCKLTNDDVWREFSACYKKDNYIYCLPDKGSSIKRFDLRTRVIEEIRIKNDGRDRLGLGFFRWDNQFYIYSIGRKSILFLEEKQDIESDEITVVNDLSKDVSCISVDHSGIVIAQKSLNIITRFSINLQKNEYNIPINDEICTLDYYCGCYWISGYKPYVYKYDDRTKEIDIIDLTLGVYDESNSVIHQNDRKPKFATSVCMNDRIWFIPVDSIRIISIDAEENETNYYEIPYESDVEKDLSNRIVKERFIIQYCLNNRYLGVFSTKNGWIIEIDTVLLKYRILDFIYDDSVGLNAIGRGLVEYEATVAGLGDFLTRLKIRSQTNISGSLRKRKAGGSI